MSRVFFADSYAVFMYFQQPDEIAKTPLGSGNPTSCVYKKMVQKLERSSEREDDADNCENHSYEPETHDDIFFGPSDCFEMMVKRRDAKDFFPVSKFLACDLYEHRKGFKNKNSAHDHECYHGIGEKCHNGESGTEWERSGVAHEEFCRGNVEPEKCKKNTDNDEGESREDVESAGVGNCSVCHKLEHQESSGESVESVRYIDAVGCRDEYEDKDRNVEKSKVHFSEKRNGYGVVFEFPVKPECTEECKNYEEYHFDSCGESFGSTDTANVQIIVECSDGTHGNKSEHHYVGFLLVPEAVGESESEPLHCDILKELGNDRYEGNGYEGKNHDKSSHRGGPLFFSVQFLEFFRFSYQSFTADVFPETIPVEESDSARHNEEREQEWENECCQNECEVGHVL